MNDRRSRRYRTGPLLACIFVVLHSAAAFPQSGAPNVVLVITDDQGYGDFGATGNAIIETPNLDAMAQRSAWMKTFYVSPVCSPTRANLLTGRYNYRTRCIDTFVGRSMMDPAEVTLAEALRDAGYATGIFGKWHLGDCYPMRAQDQGFEESLVLRGGGLAQPADPPENRDRYTDPILFHNGEAQQTKGYCTDVYFDAAMHFIDRAHQQKRPFFTYIATNAPHGPFHDVPEALRQHYLSKDLNSLMIGVPEGRREKEFDTLTRVAAMITNVDENMGRLFVHLDSLGLTDNTLVIFTNDNGPATSRYAGPFRGQKSEVYEGGVRSPLWLQWPARLKAGTSREEPVAHYDVMPTILEACGVAPPAGVQLDGRSFLPLLLDPAAAWPERTLFIQTHRGDVPQRYHQFMARDRQWKLLHASGFGNESFQGEPRFELYNLLADPGERSDLAATHPDVVARLRSAYDNWFDDVSATRPDNYAPPRIVIGTEHERVTHLTRQDWRNATWDKSAAGHWEVEFAEAGNYTFTINCFVNPVAGTIQLDVGNTVQRAALSANTANAKFENIPVAAGRTTIQARIHCEDDDAGAYQVTVERSHE
ncbi:MAG: arylsulfatase [Candidatus Hydrogenedentes bacterium]|nr:arylsulfatase [Candidatus Hydrogenedentota bacterium]